jgi:hypothetical protein
MTHQEPPSASRRTLELPDVCMATEEGWGLTSLVFGAMLLGAQALLPPASPARDARIAISGPAAAALEDSEPVREPLQ